MSNPLDESRPIADSLRYMEALVTDDDLDDEFDEITDDELTDHARILINEGARRLREQHERGRTPTEGPEAWARVEALVDRAIAERAQRVVDRIVERRRREQGDPGSGSA